MFCQCLSTAKQRGSVSDSHQVVLGSNLGSPESFSTYFWSAFPREKFCLEEWTAPPPPKKKCEDMIRPATWPFEQF